MNYAGHMEAQTVSNRGRPSVLIELIGPGLAVAAFDEGSPGDEDWRHYIETLEKLGNRGHRMLVLTTGGGPSALQRKDIEEMTESRDDVKVSVVTTSAIARGMVTALRWFRKDMTKAFAPDEFEDALDFLELSEIERRRVNDAARRLTGRIGIAGELGL